MTGIALQELFFFKTLPVVEQKRFTVSVVTGDALFLETNGQVWLNPRWMPCVSPKAICKSQVVTPISLNSIRESTWRDGILFVGAATASSTRGC